MKHRIPADHSNKLNGPVISFMNFFHSGTFGGGFIRLGPQYLKQEYGSNAFEQHGMARLEKTSCCDRVKLKAHVC